MNSLNHFQIIEQLEREEAESLAKATEVATCVKLLNELIQKQFTCTMDLLTKMQADCNMIIARLESCNGKGGRHDN